MACIRTLFGYPYLLFLFVDFPTWSNIEGHVYIVRLKLSHSMEYNSNEVVRIKKCRGRILMYKLIGLDGKEYLSKEKGTLGGHKKLKIYGKLDCPSALRHISKGHYVEHRVFFADERIALAAGYRPCGVCMKEHYQLWKEGKIMTHALSIKQSEDGSGTLCTAFLADGTQKTLHIPGMGDPSLAEYAKDGFEWVRFKIEGEYCVINLLAEEGQWGRVIVWDYIQDKIVHLTSAPFAQCSILFNGQVISLYFVAFWGHPADLWYSAEPLEVYDPNHEADRYKLPLSLESTSALDDLDIHIKSGKVVFRAGTEEYHLELV